MAQTMMLFRVFSIPFTAALLLVFALPAWAQPPNLADYDLRIEPVRDHVYVIYGPGGNIGVSVGGDGAVVIDDKFAPLTDKLQAAVATVSPRPIRFVLNTHWHPDHTGGNEPLGQAGAVIVAHERTREHLSKPQFVEFFDRHFPAMPKDGLPVITFRDSIAFHLNGDHAQVQYHPNAHTDSDVLIHFQNANVIHTGDLVSFEDFPFIDTQRGGHIDGLISATAAIAKRCDSNTLLIPGHGPVRPCSALQQYRTMLQTVRQRVATGITQGRSLAEIQASLPLREFTEDRAYRFITPDQFVELVFTSLRAPARPPVAAPAPEDIPGATQSHSHEYGHGHAH